MTEAEFRPYVDKAAEFDAALAEAVDGALQIPFEWAGAHASLRLEAVPFPRGTKANHMGPAVAWFDNSIQRLQAALIDSHMRKQARGAVQPVFVAVDCPFNGPDAGDFDRPCSAKRRSIAGSTWTRRCLSFYPNGLLVADKGIPFAGVIAFLGMRLTGAADPVLYLNRYQRWKIPVTLAAHETRVWTSRTQTKEIGSGRLGSHRIGLVAHTGTVKTAALLNPSTRASEPHGLRWLLIVQELSQRRIGATSTDPRNQVDSARGHGSTPAGGAQPRRAERWPRTSAQKGADSKRP